MAEGSTYVRESEALRGRFDQMSHDAQLLLALACAERLVRSDTVPRTASIIPQLDQGWLAVVNTRINCAPALAALEDRRDPDDDAIAAVAYALRAVLGEEDSAWHAVNRMIDDAFERVSEEQRESSFRPLDEDFAAEEVQETFRWISATITLLNESRDTSKFVESRGQA